MREAAIALAFAVLLLPAGCRTTPVTAKSRLQILWENSFMDLKVPESEWVRGGYSRTFSGASYGEVWDATVLVAEQVGVLARCSKKDGTIVVAGGIPFLVRIEGSESVTLYIRVMEDLLETDPPTRRELSPTFVDFVKGWPNRFTDFVATQLYADRKWKYLFQ
jgi:hypothetical protein